MNKFKSIKLVSIFGTIGNLFLFIIKGIIGFIFHNQGMIADAFNSLGDIFSSIMTFIGNKIASKPQDEDHNLGHGKAEYIYSLLISIAMFLVSVKLLIDSLKVILTHEKFAFSPLLIVVCLITMLVKIILYLYANFVYKKYNSLLVLANAKDHRNDFFITSCNLASILLSLVNIYFLDGLVGIGIAIWIFISALSIFKKSYDVLMDKSISEETKQKVLKIINKYKEVQKVNHFNSTPVGYQYQISFTIFVDGNLSTFQSHHIANKIEEEIDEVIPEVYLTVIHVNPIEIKEDIF